MDEPSPPSASTNLPFFRSAPASSSLIGRPARDALALTTAPLGVTPPDHAHRTAAVNAMQSTVNRYNAYGDFGNYNVYVYYNAGIPTAQANYLGSIGFGGIGTEVALGS